jgi:hypothetical protein
MEPICPGKRLPSAPTGCESPLPRHPPHGWGGGGGDFHKRGGKS